MDHYNVEQVESEPSGDQGVAELEDDANAQDQHDSGQESLDVYREFLSKGHVRSGWAINVMWPEKARKIGEAKS